MRPVQEVIGKCPCCGQAVNGFFKEIQKGHYSDSYCSTDFGGVFQPDNPDNEELGEIRPVKQGVQKLEVRNCDRFTTK